MNERSRMDAWRGWMPVALLLLATLGIGLAQAAPRPGQPVALLFPAGIDEAVALRLVLARPGWDPIALRRLGPFTLALAAPTGEAVPPAEAWLALPTLGRAPCAAPPSAPRT